MKPQAAPIAPTVPVVTTPPTALASAAAPLQALRQAVKAWELARDAGDHGQFWAVAEASLGLAQLYRQMGALPSALAQLDAGLLAAQGADQRVELLCECITVLTEQSEQCEAQRRGSGRAAREAARAHVFETRQLASRVADSRWQATVLLHLSDALDRVGDHQQAQQLQGTALSLMAQPCSSLDRSSGTTPDFGDPRFLPASGQRLDS